LPSTALSLRRSHELPPASAPVLSNLLVPLTGALLACVSLAMSAEAVDELPDGITLEGHRELHGRQRYVWIRRGLLCCIAVLPLPLC
jgi:hypothetical protein